MTTSQGKRRTVLVPGEFAQQIGLYLWHRVAAEGGDRSGRWMEKKTDQSKSYWSKILNLTQAMTTNDIAVAAEVFKLSPYEFVRAARAHTASRHDAEIIRGRFGVGGLGEDDLDAVARERDPEPMDEQ